jgi:hypothetical protein
VSGTAIPAVGNRDEEPAGEPLADQMDRGGAVSESGQGTGDLTQLDSVSKGIAGPTRHTVGDALANRFLYTVTSGSRLQFL